MHIISPPRGSEDKDRSPIRVLGSEDLMYGYILPYLPLEAAQALACCSKRVRNAVL